MPVELSMDWAHFFDDLPVADDAQTDSISDAFVKCLNAKGCVDIEYIASLSGCDPKAVIAALKGSIYQDPKTWNERFDQGWVTAEAYLSGNIRQKLLAAEKSNEKYHGYFRENVDALKSVMPPGVSAGEIYVTLGSPWVPADVIRDFISYVSGIVSSPYDLLRHDEATGTWELSYGLKVSMNSYRASMRYSTGRRKASEILIRTLNMQSVVVMDTIESRFTKSGKQRVINQNETVLALEKQKLMIDDFRKWVWSDPKRASRLKSIYEGRYASVRQRHFDGSFLAFPGMNPKITLYRYQKNAVARILFSPNTLLAHDVGSGKTYIMIAAGMELKRLHLSKKNLYVVPNNIIGQWRNFFDLLYPNARVRCIEPKDFTPAKREAALSDLRDSDYDAVIMAYSCFTQIPISKDCRIRELRLQIKELELLLEDRKKATERLVRRVERLREEIYELSDEKETDAICFDQLGITTLFVDEAHNFKNVPIDTKIENAMGISKTGSTKCRDMMDKVHIVQHENHGRGVIFATGTPITNSITDAYIMQRYLQGGELAILELQNFDSWVGMFAEQTSNFEIDVDTSNFRMATRFAKFHNIPELTAMFAAVADFHMAHEAKDVPEHDGYRDLVVRKTKEFQEYLKDISRRADDVRHGRVARTDDNMLKITTDGRKAALDMRLIDPAQPFTVSSKVFLCADSVAAIYKDTIERRSTQLVFCDTSTPKAGFNIYDNLRALLIRMGVSADEIAYIHDATTESKRAKIFESVRKGEIRVLIGSTFKLGLGVNVQDKLIALHHLDVPWRPADMVQREGRILRQGNENEKVEIFRYITEGSFDAYSWQLLETKQRFITDILSGTSEERTGSDIDDTVLNYAEVKALAIGNPLIRERVEVANDLTKYLILQQKVIAQHEQFEKELSEIPEKLERIRGLIPTTKADADYYAENKKTYSLEERLELGKRIYLASHPVEPTQEESIAVTYQGFDVVVPQNCSDLHPVVFLRRAGNYMVELGSSDVGGMMRIDRCLHDLEKRYESLVKKENELTDRSSYMKRELEKNASYYDEIECCRMHLMELDEKLGVGKDE